MTIRCKLGGAAPCIDDLCNGVDTTLCGLSFGFDFCEHDNDPDTCEDCSSDNDEFAWPAGDPRDDEEDAVALADAHRGGRDYGAHPGDR